MICFEEFDPQTNYPVVLPCGHTYVCIECANKIDICMECRTPLTIKMEIPPPPPPPNTPGTPSISSTPSSVAAAAAAAAGGSPLINHHETQKENYADRVRNSPGFRRRYGHRDEYNNNTSNSNTSSNKRIIARGPNGQPNPPVKVPTQRLPLPKNAVLLSLIQASEPARRRAEVEAPPTPVKTDDKSVSNGNLGNLSCGTNNSDTPSPATSSHQRVCGGSENNSLPKFSRPSPLFLDGSSSGERDYDHTNTNLNLQGSSADDEEHKIRVGTYLEGGPCGTYAVAVKSGLLVYPTLFEHTLPSALNGVLRNSSNNNTNNGIVVEEDVLKRNVDEVMKNYYRESATKKKQLEKERLKMKKKKKKKQQSPSSKKKSSKKKDDMGEEENLNNSLEDSSTTKQSELGSSTWVECHDNENVEAHFGSSTIGESSSTMMSMSSSRHSILPMKSCEEEDEEEDDDDDDEEEEDEDTSCDEESSSGDEETRFPSTMSDPGGNNIGECNVSIAMMSDPGIPTLPSTTHSADDVAEAEAEGGGGKRDTSLDHSGFSSDDNIIDDDDNVGLKLSLSISGDDINNNDGFVSGDDDDVENDSTNNKEGTTMPRLSSLSKDSDSDNNDTIGTSVRTLPARRSQSIAQTSGLTTNRGSNSSSSSKDDGLLHAGNAKKFVRHFSQGSYPPLSNSASPKKKKNCVEGGGNNEGSKINTNNDDFERPLIRLKYGDRVQVVSMDSRGWVKLARGYGYIRLENDKQLVKG